MNSSVAQINRFDIDPRDFKINTAYGGCLLVWSLGIIGFGIVCVLYKFWVLVAFAGALALMIPFALNARYKVQSFLVDSDGLRIVKNANVESGIRISREATLELTLEYVESGGDTDRESVSTLNLWDHDLGYRRRHIIGLWISDSCREQLYQSLRDFLVEANFRVIATNKLSNANKASFPIHD